MNNKKTILHFTLAVALIVGIFITAKLRPVSTSSSHYLTDLSQTIEIKDDSTLSKDSLDENQIGINDMQNEGGSKAKTDVLCEDCEENSAGNDIVSKKTIADIRYNFDVNSADQVKEVQRILGLEEDGIFGPKTSSAYQAAISGYEPKNLYAKENPEKKTESPLSTTNAMLD